MSELIAKREKRMQQMDTGMTELDIARLLTRRQHQLHYDLS